MSLVHALLGPFSVKTSVTDKNHAQNPVTVTVDTSYPFSDSLKYTITAKEAFDFYVRIPTWAQSAGLSYQLNSGHFAGTFPATGTIKPDNTGPSLWRIIIKLLL